MAVRPGSEKLYAYVDKILDSALTICDNDPVLANAVLAITTGEATALAGNRLGDALALVAEAFDTMAKSLERMPLISGSKEEIAAAIAKAVKAYPSLAGKEEALQKAAEEAQALLKAKQSDFLDDELAEPGPKKDDKGRPN